MTWSPETTWLPAKAPHEIRDKAAGTVLVNRIQRWLNALHHKTGLSLRAKLDPFRLTNPFDLDSTEAWIIEVVPVLYPFETDWLDEESESYAGFMRGIRLLFSGMRKRFGLVPAVSKRVRRGGRLIQRDHPSAGCHVHMGADLFCTSTSWYRLTQQFHRNLIMDYANRPYIRWLLAQWSDDKNSECAVKREDFGKNGKLQPTADQIWERTVENQPNIESRFMASSKNSYLTFEFRFIDMVRSAEELRAVVLILKGWMDHVASETVLGHDIAPTITRADWLRYTDLRRSKKYIKSWLDSISQTARVCAVSDTLFNRNYRNRLLYGKAC